MCCKGFLKRLVPFFLTFAVGLFIASFFMTIAAPNFQFPSRDRKRKHYQYDRQREIEIQRLRDENVRLKSELKDSQSFSAVDFSYAVPPLPPMPPAPPMVKTIKVDPDTTYRTK